ncbi:hypothetical protein [Cohnella nanjingensis]|uniref:hypothetical protein n=1 Tax=Cohnella nanjingensis TaxID=1387779 RepID=UPI001C88339C|nr:hypothetical protein [Cohnella nanjingensis]
MTNWMIRLSAINKLAPVRDRGRLVFAFGANIAGLMESGTNIDMIGYQSNESSGPATDLQIQHNHAEVLRQQDSLMKRLFKTLFIWISLAGIAISIVMTL